MGLSESDTGARLIDAAIHARGWTGDLGRREATSGGIEVVDGNPRKRGKGRVGYTLHVKADSQVRPVVRCGLAPRVRSARAGELAYKHAGWPAAALTEKKRRVLAA